MHVVNFVTFFVKFNFEFCVQNFSIYFLFNSDFTNYIDNQSLFGLFWDTTDNLNPKFELFQGYVYLNIIREWRKH